MKQEGENNVYETFLSLSENGTKLWYRICFRPAKSIPSLPEIAKAISEKKCLTLFIGGRLAPYEDDGKVVSNAFSLSGYKAEKMKQKAVLTEERLPETQDEVPADKAPVDEPVDNSADTQESEVTFDIPITIGIHNADKPLLSSLTSEDDKGWMRSVIKYYTDPTEEEANQICAMKVFLASCK
jgi:hypothetical protein